MSAQTLPANTDTNRGVTRWAIREGMGLIMYLPLLFWPAGTWDWPMAWALIALTALWVIATALVSLPRYPELLAERVRPRQDSKRWDTTLLGLIGGLMLVKLIVAGFNRRFEWTAGFSPALEIAGLAAAAVGYGLVVWAMGSNAYFSQVVRIQKERGHTVARGGPYRLIRHPAYLGMILTELGTSLMLGTWLALIPGIISVALILLRTHLEDRTLLAELDGYPEFAQKTRYRLLPGVW